MAKVILSKKGRKNANFVQRFKKIKENFVSKLQEKTRILPKDRRKLQITPKHRRKMHFSSGVLRKMRQRIVENAIFARGSQINVIYIRLTQKNVISSKDRRENAKFTKEWQLKHQKLVAKAKIQSPNDYGSAPVKTANINIKNSSRVDNTRF